jgi:hypothetical protein
MASLPIRGLGHAIVLRMLTGDWRHFGIFVVKPTASIQSRGSTGSAGSRDIAVVRRWQALFLNVRRGPASLHGANLIECPKEKY